MISRFMLAACLAAASLVSGRAQAGAPARPPYPAYMLIDGKFYGVSYVTPTAEMKYESYSWEVPYTTAIACARSNGQAQQFSVATLLYDATPDFVFIATAVFTAPGHGTSGVYDLLTMTSTTGDIICSGKVAGPDEIFANGFQP